MQLPSWNVLKFVVCVSRKTISSRWLYIESKKVKVSLRKQETFGDATIGFPAKWRLRNERRNSILMTRHYPDLGSASDWSCRVGNLIQPIRSSTQIWVVTRDSMDFLCSFLRRHLAVKWPVVASSNVGCFLSLGKSPYFFNGLKSAAALIVHPNDWLNLKSRSFLNWLFLAISYQTIIKMSEFFSNVEQFIRQSKTLPFHHRPVKMKIVSLIVSSGLQK